MIDLRFERQASAILVSAFAGAMLICGVARAGDANTISGAGATFPYPVYAKWADTYAKATQIKLNYQAIGSGGGIKQISEGTVDFGASDAPLKPEELEKAGATSVSGGLWAASCR